MNYKYPFFILVTGMIVASVIPFGISQTPEDAFMEIDMLVGQTEDPFRIQDTWDNDVFTIDTNGIIYPSQDGWAKFLYKSGTGGEVTTVTDSDQDNPIVLAEWTISYSDVSSPFVIIPIDLVMMSAEVIRTSGSNTCVISGDAFKYGSWESLESQGSVSATWENIEQESQAYQDDSWDGFRYSVWMTGDGTGTCEWKNIAWRMAIVETPNLTVVRVS